MSALTNVSRRSRRPRIASAISDASFVIPGLVLFFTFVVWPTGRGILYAFTDWNGFTPSAHWVGIANFRSILHDSSSLGPVRTTIAYTVAFVVGVNAVGLGLALALNRPSPLVSLLRTVFLVPITLSLVATGYIWNYIFYPDHGTLNGLLRGVGLSSWQHPWLADPHWALWCVAATAIWQSSALYMLIYLAALQGVPVELHEAAALDGAGPVRRLWHVTLPKIVPAFLICVPLSLISGLKVFEIVLVMTRGGPGDATQTLATSVIQRSFAYQQAGYGTALGVMLLVLTLIAALTSVGVIRRIEARTA